MRDLPTCADLPAAYCPAAKTPGSELFRRPAPSGSDGKEPPRSDALPGCRDDVEVVPDPTLTWEDPGSWAQGPQGADQAAPDEEVGTLPDPTLSWEDPDSACGASSAEAAEIGELPDPTLSWEEPDEAEQSAPAPQAEPVDEFPDPLLPWEEPVMEEPRPVAEPLPVPGPVPVEAGPEPEQAPQPAPPPVEEPEPVLPPELRHGMETPDEPRPVHLLTPATDSAWGAPLSRRIVPTAGQAKSEPKKRTVPKDNGCWQCS